MLVMLPVAGHDRRLGLISSNQYLKKIFRRLFRQWFESHGIDDQPARFGVTCHDLSLAKRSFIPLGLTSQVEDRPAEHQQAGRGINCEYPLTKTVAVNCGHVILCAGG